MNSIIIYRQRVFFILIFYSISNFGQKTNKIIQDTIKQESGRLDIADESGIYIMADNGKTQFRIVGSIRFSALNDDRLMSDKSSFSSYDIPTGEENFRVLNYYNSLMYTRIGYEVTRETGIGQIFIRLETDFAGQDSAYRIRHAYAQFRKWLVGQTWSLFTNVNAQTISVNRNGPPGTISIRTPQIRYSFDIPYKNLKGMAALEYSLPQVTSVDSITNTTINVQTVPNLTAKISKKSDRGYLQLAGILAPVSGVDNTGSKSSILGFGVSFSGYWNTHSINNKLLFQGTYGRAVSHFINMFRHSQQDMIYNSNTGKFEALNTLSGNLSFEHSWNKNMISNVSFGMADFINKDFQNPESYDYSYSASANTFYTIVKGARVGLAYMFGQRINIDHSKGNASRLWILFYYDF